MSSLMRCELLQGSDELSQGFKQIRLRTDRVREELFGFFLTAGVHPRRLNCTIVSPTTK
jgi:hypothetical protein